METVDDLSAESVWDNVTARLALHLDFAAQVTEHWRAPLAFCGEADLVEAVGVLGRLQEARDAILLRVVTELEERGVDSPGGLSRVDWLRSVDPSLTAGAARAVVRTAQATREPRWRELGQAVADGRVTASKAAQVIAFYERLRGVADPDELDCAVEHLTEQSATVPPEELARMCRLHSDQIRPPRDLDRLDDARRSARGLWFSHPNATGMVRMTGMLDPESSAALRSAIDPLSAPSPLTDASGATIESDPRPAHQRRLDALVDLIGRGVSSPGSAPSTEKAKVVVTMDLDGLIGRTRAAAACLSGDVLSPSTVRRLACDAGIVPAVLGSDSQPLDVGRTVRLVTAAMRTALWLRDRGCTFPGCTVPVGWTDAHHVVHWFDGGATSVANLALLCRRHHTHVHRHGLTATVDGPMVTWHTPQTWSTGPPERHENPPRSTGKAES